MHAQPKHSSTDASAEPQVVADPPEELLDTTPPPAHEGWLEACENGLRAIRERQENRRRKKQQGRQDPTQQLSHPQPAGVPGEPHCVSELDDLPWDKTPPPDHDEFERLAELGRRAIRARRERGRRKD